MMRASRNSQTKVGNKEGVQVPTFLDPQATRIVPLLLSLAVRKVAT